MKKYILPLFAVGLLAFSSCTKDWTCQCDGTFLGFAGTESEEYKDMKRSDAKTECDNLETNVNKVPGTEATCKLK